MVKILITGGSGQLGSSLKGLLENRFEIITPSSNEMNFISTNKIIRTLKYFKPYLIINCAAYTNVEKANKEKNLCKKINADAIKVISNYSKNNNIKLIHISTDYVFGNRMRKVPWKESDDTNPLNFYGQTKLEGEKHILANDFDSLIIRTSGIYSNIKKKNFLNSMIQLAQSNKEIGVVHDQISSPTPSWWLAKVLLEIIEKKLDENFDAKIKILHTTVEGEVSWYEFAKKIFKYLEDFKMLNKSINIKRISYKSYPTNVQRPNYSVLDNSLLNKLGIVSIDWKKALRLTIKNRREIYERI